MSLRSFHIFFIVTALGLLLFVTYWSGSRVVSGVNGQSLILAVVSAAGFAIGFSYLGWFLKKTKSP